MKAAVSSSRDSKVVNIKFFYLLVLCYVILPVPFDFFYKTEVLTLPFSAALRTAILLLLIWSSRHRLRSSSLFSVLVIFCVFTVILFTKNIFGHFGSPYLIVKIAAVVGLVILMDDTLKVEDSVVLIKLFLLTYSLNVIPTALGAIYDITEFSWGSSERFGYSGLLPDAGNEAAVFLMVMFTAAYVNHFYFNYLNISRLFSASLLMIIFTCMVLMGSKLTILYPLIILICHRLSLRQGYLILLLISIGGLAVYMNAGYIRSMYSYLFDYYSDRGLLSTLLMSRDTRLSSYDLDFSISGMFLGNAGPMVNFEMDFFTIYYNLGVFGLITLMLPFGYYVIPRIRTRISLGYSLSLVGAIFLAGHIIESGFLLLPLVALSKILSHYERKKLRY